MQRSTNGGKPLLVRSRANRCPDSSLSTLASATHRPSEYASRLQVLLSIGWRLSACSHPSTRSSSGRGALARRVKRLPMLATGRRAPTSCSSSPTTMLDFIVAFYSRCTRGYKWLCSACIHGTTMRNTTGERVHIAACAARQKNRPSFGHFSTCESSMEASLGVSEAPKSVVGTWYAPFSAVLRSQNQNTPPNDKICYTVRERTELQLVKRHACVQGPHPSRVPACSVGARSTLAAPARVPYKLFSQ